MLQMNRNTENVDYETLLQHYYLRSPISTYLNRKPRNQIASFLSGMTRKDGRLQIRFYAVVTFPKRKCYNFFKLRVEF